MRKLEVIEGMTFPQGKNRNAPERLVNAIVRVCLGASKSPTIAMQQMRIERATGAAIGMCTSLVLATASTMDLMAAQTSYQPLAAFVAYSIGISLLGQWHKKKCAELAAFEKEWIARNKVDIVV